MLGAADFGNVRGSFEQVIALLGVPAQWRQAKPPHSTANAVVGFKTAGRDDAEVVNAYGMNSKIITCAAKDFATAPEKFDTFTISGQRYTADNVQIVHLNGTTIGYKVYIRGQA